MTPKLVIGTRGSALALWQANRVADLLRKAHPDLEVTLLIIRTAGDRFQEAQLTTLGGKEAFTKELQDALLARRIDAAVHSLKDLPVAAVTGLRVWAYPEREDPRDAWLGRDGLRYADLKAGAVVATASLRRAAQIKARFPEVTVVPVRGNVDTRLRKLKEGTMSGMLLARAGLARLGLADAITETLEPAVMLPAPGQGALAVEGRSDSFCEGLLAPLDNPAARDRVSAERAFLGGLGGDCLVPIAGLAELRGDTLHLEGLIADADGQEVLRDHVEGPRQQARQLGEALARSLIARGARRIMDALRQTTTPA